MVRFCAISSSFHSRFWFALLTKGGFTKSGYAIASRKWFHVIFALAIIRGYAAIIREPKGRAIIRSCATIIRGLPLKETEETFLSFRFFSRHTRRSWFEVIARVDHLIDHSPIRNTTKIAIVDKKVGL